MLLIIIFTFLLSFYFVANAVSVLHLNLQTGHSPEFHNGLPGWPKRLNAGRGYQQADFAC